MSLVGAAARPNPIAPLDAPAPTTRDATSPMLQEGYNMEHYHYFTLAGQKVEYHHEHPGSYIIGDKGIVHDHADPGLQTAYPNCCSSQTCGCGS